MGVVPVPPLGQISRNPGTSVFKVSFLHFIWFCFVCPLVSSILTWTNWPKYFNNILVMFNNLVPVWVLTTRRYIKQMLANFRKFIRPLELKNRLSTVFILVMVPLCQFNFVTSHYNWEENIQTASFFSNIGTHKIDPILARPCCLRSSSITKLQLLPCDLTKCHAR